METLNLETEIQYRREANRNAWTSSISLWFCSSPA